MTQVVRGKLQIYAFMVKLIFYADCFPIGLIVAVENVE
jgi:hypothetical protein